MINDSRFAHHARNPINLQFCGFNRVIRGLRLDSIIDNSIVSNHDEYFSEYKGSFSGLRLCQRDLVISIIAKINPIIVAIRVIRGKTIVILAIIIAIVRRILGIIFRRDSLTGAPCLWIFTWKGFRVWMQSLEVCNRVFAQLPLGCVLHCS